MQSNKKLIQTAEAHAIESGNTFISNAIKVIKLNKRISDIEVSFLQDYLSINNK